VRPTKPSPALAGTLSHRMGEGRRPSPALAGTLSRQMGEGSYSAVMAITKGAVSLTPERKSMVRITIDGRGLVQEYW
jgi:hypothetical protein